MHAGDFMKAKLIVAAVVLGMAVLVLLTGCGNICPVASFTCIPTSGEAPLSVSFDASASSDVDGSITSYAWTFGDAQNGSGVTANHSYIESGIYTTQLTVTDDDGDTDDSTTRTIYVSPSSVGSDEATIQETTTPERLWGVFGNSSGSIFGSVGSIEASPRTTPNKPSSSTHKYLSESTQRKIFYDIIATQDQHPYSNEWNQDVKQAAADHYNVPMNQISDIIQKGATEGWLQPDPP